MRRYGHKCHFKIIIFYSTFSLSSQYLIQHFLSLLIVFSLSSRWSLSLSSSDHPPSPSNQQQSSRRSLIKSSHRSTYAIVQRYDDLTDQQYSIILRLYLAFSLPSRHADLAITDLAIADLGFVGLCRWMWMWMWVSGCGFGIWVCADLSSCAFFLFLRWRWWMWVCVSDGCQCCCGSGCWWSLLQQWWLCRCCCWWW